MMTLMHPLLNLGSPKSYSPVEEKQIIDKLGLEQNVVYTLGAFHSGIPVKAIWTGDFTRHYYRCLRKDILSTYFAHNLPASPDCIHVIGWDCSQLNIDDEKNVIRIGPGPFLREEIFYHEGYYKFAILSEALLQAGIR